MCGIVGIWLKNEFEIVQKEQLLAGITAISHRGPNAKKIKIDANVGLAHARLSIMDLSDSADQPMTDESGRYTLVFNGEVYNVEHLRDQLPDTIVYKTTSDTEVLMYFLIEFGLDNLNELNGFFSFVMFDHAEKEIIFARDRYGIKPLLIYEDGKKIIFSSEIGPIFKFDINRTLDQTAINLLFRLTYIPAPNTILANAKSVLPGYCGSIKKGVVTMQAFYDVNTVKPIIISYDEAKKEVRSRVESAVEKRMIADVPLGTFLSGGVDSSIVSLVAKKYKKDLKTFSIGFDVDYFDESKFSMLMADFIDSDHHQIQLNQTDFTERFQSFLELNHQPFADSSAFAVYLLSEKTKEHVTVCLSGDGADELFGGYRKHEAEFKINQLSSVKRAGVRALAITSRYLPQGRHGKWLEMNRKLQKLAKGLKQQANERYWDWLCFIDEKDCDYLLKSSKVHLHFDRQITADLNSVLLADQTYVLPNDMLTKVDRMSMAHGLEVRTPFLDHELVDFVNSLPAAYKVNKNGRKQILIDAFKDQLPIQIYKREKKGFEVPLFDWLRKEIVQVLESEVFSRSYILRQEIFNYEAILALKLVANSPKFGEKVYLFWTLIIFQNWWHKNINQ